MLAELVFSFDKKYATTFSEIGIQITQLKDKKNEYQQTLNQKLKLELNQFNQKIGGLEWQISQSERRIPQSLRISMPDYSNRLSFPLCYIAGTFRLLEDVPGPGRLPSYHKHRSRAVW